MNQPEEKAGSGVYLQADRATKGNEKSGWSRHTRAAGKIVFCAAALVMVAAVFPSGARGKSPNSLSAMPDAPARQLIAGKCGSACHDATHVLDHTRTRDEWTDIVVLMRDYGAKVSVDEQKTIVAYLAKNFGHAPVPVKPVSPDPPANVRTNSPGRTGATPASHSPHSSSVTQAAGKSSAAVKLVSVPAASSLAALGPGGTATGSAAPGGLPPGAGRELVQTKCTMCHNLDRVVESHRTPEEWQQLVTMMQEYGADVYDQDETTVVKYLSKSFPAAGSGTKGSAGRGGPAK